MKKSCATFIFLSHFVTMAIDSANPAPDKKTTENIVGKRENTDASTDKQQYLHYVQISVRCKTRQKSVV